MTSLVGTKLGRYEVVEELGQGGMSVVYRANDPVFSRQVAIKVMHGFLTEHEDARQRFNREGRAAGNLNHPHIIQIYDGSGEDARTSYLVTELVEGKAMSRALPEGLTPPEAALLVARPIVDALAHAHQHGVVHRDLKPENILVSPAGVLKLTDFGIARLLGEHTLTMTGTLLGSPAYMAPEYIDGQPTDARADIFSFGVMLYQLAVGRLPFSGPTPHTLLKRIASGEYAPPEQANPHVHAQLARIINRALEGDPARRYQSAGELLADIDAMIERLGIDAASGLKALLAEPAACGRELSATLSERYLALGRAALTRGATGAAIEDFNRILEFDPNHSEVRAILKRLAARQWTWRILRAAGLGALGAALVTLAAPSLAEWWRAPPAAQAAQPVAIASGLPFALSRDVPFEIRGRGDLYIDDVLVRSGAVGVVPHALPPGPHTVRLVGDKKSDEARFTVPAQGSMSAVKLDVLVTLTAPVRTREVAFRPGTGWVTAYVDGAKTPAVREAIGDFKLRLPYGTRRLRFENDRAQPLDYELMVSDSAPPGIVVVHLKPLPAKLYIDGAPDGAIVEVAGKATIINERTRDEPIFIPLEFAPGEKTRAYDVSVKKDGQTVRQRLVFHAGQVQRLPVRMEPLAVPPALE